MAAVPFHYWTPDAYQGSPTPVTAYLSVGPKVGAFAIALRLFVGALGPLKADWLPVVIVLAAATMTLGNLVAREGEPTLATRTFLVVDVVDAPREHRSLEERRAVEVRLGVEGHADLREVQHHVRDH